MELPHHRGIDTLAGILQQVLVIIVKDPIHHYFMLAVLAQVPLLLAIRPSMNGGSDPVFLLFLAL